MATTQSASTTAPTSLEDAHPPRRQHHHHHASTSSSASNTLHNNNSSSLPTRSQSTRVRSAVPPSPHRSNSTAHANHHHHHHHHSSSSTSSSRRQPHPIDDEQHANLAHVSSSSSSARRRSSSKDKDRPPPPPPPYAARPDPPPPASQHRSDRGGTSSSQHRAHHARHPSDMATAVANGGVAPVVNPNEAARHSRSSRTRTTIPAQSGEWILGKTIGAGSMGKVKLARKAEGGEQVAVKIVPRGVTDDGHQHQSKADRERAEHSKEVRTAREAAIVTLLDHPYICGMRDVVRTTYHWYMLFEYVNGGQMLDYIISHGRLKEKQARKFSRQIASALDYCHRNSIVHRDLKIENILISKTGDIKIIDFGLSNLFAPRSHLKTFCGSLYFAAPELLQAKAYTGPEVDVWSFGIVLYVLVCGKVPFDDQSMPALHAKIKKGVVDYPNWLSPECKNLISRMLVTDPRQRASLQEIMTHPWMTKGFGSPPENYLPVREPLQMPLDPRVIQAMTGFDFGPPEEIERQLSEVIQSQDYMRAVKLALQEKENMAPLRDAEKKRGFGFDFYKRRNSSNSRDTLSAPSSELLTLGNDPVNAYNPLISVYYLVREKQERDRLQANPGATSMPREKGEAPLQMPETVVAPKPAHTNSAAYEMAGEKPTGGRSRPRARTHGEDEVTENLRNVKISGPGAASPAIVEPPPEPARKESTATSILRRFSTRRRKEPSDRSHPPIVTLQSPQESSTLRKSFSVRRARDRSTDNAPALPRAGSSQPQHSDLLSPPPKSSTKGLGRSASVASAEFRRRGSRRGGTDAPSPRITHQDARDPPPTSGSDHSTGNEKAPPSRDEDKGRLLTPTSASRTKSLGHARRESIQARRARREEAREANVPEETDAEMGDASGPSTERVDRAENVKPVFLKGLFSVSTTSTKPVAAIRADIIRVLKMLGVEYTEIRSGFSCRHVPSIDLKKVNDAPPTSHGNAPGHKRRISFGGFMGGNKDTERDDYREAERSPRTPKNHRNADRSYTNSDASEESLHRPTGGHSSRAAGETMTHVQSDLGGSMVLEFEIFIVKVPLLSFHGIQFKRLAGGTWQYKSMADQILRELRL